MLLVTHDMGVIAETADRVAVMYAGRIVEIGTVEDVIRAPMHPYSRGLMGAIPSLEESTGPLAQIDGAMPRLNARPTGCAFHPRCPDAMAQCREQGPRLEAHGMRLVSCWAAGQPRTNRMSALPAAADPGTDTCLDVSAVTRHFPVGSGILRGALGGGGRSVKAVDGVSFRIRQGETFSLVGESGCGKSTLARVIAGLDAPTAGTIRFADAAQAGHRIQMIFQDPYASLNPRYRIGSAIAEPIRFQKLLRADAVLPRVHELLRQVGLAPADAVKFPHEFSGGQRQRVSIARALAGNPTFLVCDEPTSALRCVGTGTDPEPVAPVAAGTWSHLPLHQPQPGRHQLRVARRRRDVPRSPDGGSTDARTVRGAQASLHATSAGGVAAARYPRP